MNATKLGEILRDNGIISFLQLSEALQIQKEERGRIGDVLVGLGYLTKRQLRYIIREYKKRIPLGEYLVEKGIIGADALDRALNHKESGIKPLGQILVESRAITEDDLAKALSEQLDMPFIVPYQRLVDTRVFNRLPPEFMRHHGILPLHKIDGITTVLVSGLIDESIAVQLESVFGQDIDLAIAPPSRIEQTINALVENRTVPEIGEVQAEAEAPPEAELGRIDIGGESIRALGVESKAVELVNYIISEAIREGASDVHMEPLPDRLQVRFRINGVMTHKADLPLRIRGAMFGRIKALAGLNVADTQRDQEGRLMGHIEKLKVDMRVSIFVTVHGEALNLRVLSQNVGIMDLHDLGLMPNAYSICRRALDYASGLMVFAGPPASGKTTSMFAALKYLSEKKLKIVTVEDPVESVLPGAVQGQRSLHRDEDLADILAAAVRQDPDVIAIGQIPPGPEGRKVLHAALTGHKMLTTIHADDTIGALLRLTDAGLDMFLRSSTALTIVCQRLVRKICPNCQSPLQPAARALAQFPVKDFDPAKYDFFHGRGCATCLNTGFAGRTGIFEVLLVTDEIREAFLAGANSREIVGKARASTPFLTINEVGVLKVIRKMTTVDEFLRVAPLISRDREMRNPLTLEEIERISESSGFGE